MIKVEEEIKRALAQVTEREIDEIEIDENTELISGSDDNYLSMSSIDYVEFLVTMEDMLDIVFDFSARIETVGDLISYIDGAKEE